MNPPIYRLVFGHPIRGFKVYHQGSYAECVAHRKVSGDLILTPEGTVSQEGGWLFWWEKLDPTCYARRMQREGWTE